LQGAELNIVNTDETDRQCVTCLHRILAGADRDICEGRRKYVMKDMKRIRMRKSAIRKSEGTENK